MGLESLGSLGYQIGAAGIFLVAMIYFVIVRWWTDVLGRVLAGILGTTTSVLVMVALRQIGVDLPGGFLAWRAIVFVLFAVAVWSGLITLVWAQFLAPRLKLSTPRRRGYEQEADLADSRPDRDGSADHDPAGQR